MQEQRSAVDIVWRLVLFLWALTILFPLVWIAYQSLKTNVEFFQNVWALPEVLKWQNYANAWKNYALGSTMLNTLYYVGVSLVLSVFMTTLTAYCLTRLEFKYRRIIWASIMFSLFLPGINALVPQYLLVKALGMTNSLTGLIVLSSFGESVFFLMLLGGFMSSLPKELEESAYMDGASFFATFMRIIVPLSTPGIVTVSIFKFLGLYNNFLAPFIYLSDPKKYTIGVAMYEANTRLQYSADWVTMFAGVFIAMAPTIILYVLFQKRIMEGATLGAVKG